MILVESTEEYEQIYRKVQEAFGFDTDHDETPFDTWFKRDESTALETYPEYVSVTIWFIFAF